MNALVRMNQLGYLPGMRKWFVTDVKAEEFEVLDAEGTCVWMGRLEGPHMLPASAETVFVGDLSAVDQAGLYTIRIPGVGTGPAFRIGPDVYIDVQQALLKFFYYQRCGTDLLPQYAGAWTHAACHLGDCIDYEQPQLRRPSPGGWHDAGDYGKYTVAAAVTVADLLLAYECFPQVFAIPVGIPESGGDIPDILSEVAYELRWLWTMQRADGAVYHKVTTKEFPGLGVMPENDLAPLYFAPVSAAATGAFAAVMAMAARVYRTVHPELATRCLQAARRAYHWREENPQAASQGFINPPDIHTGEYGDVVVADEWYWASAELWRATGDMEYLAAAQRIHAEGGFDSLGLGWADVGGYGTLALLLGGARESGLGTDADWLAGPSRAWQERAQSLAALSQANPYGVCLDEPDYIWGSNMVLLHRAMHLIFADRLAQTDTYREQALAQLHYLLGCNPLAQCYVSGFGYRPMIHPHHRPSVADGVLEPVPGMVAGGPNRHRQDEAARARLREGTPPARCYVDDEGSYSTNEVAIYWNAPAVFVAAYANASKI
ncbi:glycoside hydrolase family 9 protein [Alicyclobacillus shizuokensis]|uniref:glycoside hydrolase family 9 protein n=1 Tax=Alicyclobacillus shizuokensis TaxID=392014 RepID=UPI00082F56DB|nr:glycoside hydrolase family 9 protein [Alicyclobacillus shizuokensis]MCL6624980.1 glycoside hydrolase family 9 protein [Alicyclobacillus shizuokensis]